MLLPISLTAAGAAALLHIWLSVRVSQVRRAQQILHGDGGSPALLKRMRAHSNYGENLPVFLILLVLLELAGVWSLPLWIATIAFFLARILHAFGMDKDKLSPLRMIGVLGSWLVLLGLAGWAIATTYADMGSSPARQQAPVIKA